MHSIKKRLLGALGLLWLSNASMALNPDSDRPQKDQPHGQTRTVTIDSRLPLKPNFDADPIRFTLRPSKSAVRVGEEFELTITAHYFNISPSLLFTTAGSNAFRLKLLIPEGFVQTGGDYVDYIGAELTPVSPTITYHIKGHFRTNNTPTDFRLLRGHYQADANSLFVEKGTISVRLDAGTVRNARAADDYVNVAADCGNSRLSITGKLTPENNGRINVQILKDGNIISTLSDLVGPSINQSVALNGAGTYQARLMEVNRDNNNILSSGVGINCSSGTTTPPPNNPNPPSSGCNWSEGQFIINWYGEQIYAHYYNGVLYASYQDGVNGFKPRHWLVAANAMSQDQTTCFATDDPHTTSGGTTNPPSNPNPPTSGNCSVSNPASSLDIADCNVVAGWALDQSNMSQPVLIDIYVDGVKTYAGITANGDRQDVANAFGNSAARYHGFSYSLPANASWRDGQNHTISVRICGANGEVNGSPRTVGGCTGGSGGTPPTTNPTSNGCGTGEGLLGYYMNSVDLSSGAAGIRLDGSINFTWGSASPLSGVNSDQFSVTWMGLVEAPVTGSYTFKTYNDDATRLWVNGQLIIDDWNGHPPTWQQGTVSLTAGQKYEIKMDFADVGGDAQAQLYWQYPGQDLQIIPSCRLYKQPDVLVQSVNCSGYSKVTTGCVTIYYDCLGSVRGGEYDKSIPGCADGGAAGAGSVPGSGPGSGPSGNSPGGGEGSSGSGVPGSGFSSGGIGGNTSSYNLGSLSQQMEKIRYQVSVEMYVKELANRGINLTYEEQLLFRNDRDIYFKARDQYPFQKPDFERIIFSELGIQGYDELERLDFSYPPGFPIVSGTLYALKQMQRVSRERVALALQHPDWGSTYLLYKAYLNVSSGDLHFVLDVFGLVPVAGEPADAINGAVYLLEGNKTDAAISLAGMIPIAGWAATGGKWARAGLQAVGDATFKSTEGLVFTVRKYKRLKQDANALSHILEHFSDADKTSHGIFTIPMDDLIGTLDDAWKKVKNSSPDVVTTRQSDGSMSYLIPVDGGRVIGKSGGTSGTGAPLNRLRIIIDDIGVRTAFPE